MIRHARTELLTSFLWTGGDKGLAPSKFFSFLYHDWIWSGQKTRHVDMCKYTWPFTGILWLLKKMCLVRHFDLQSLKYAVALFCLFTYWVHIMYYTRTLRSIVFTIYSIRVLDFYSKFYFCIKMKTRLKLVFSKSKYNILQP